MNIIGGYPPESQAGYSIGIKRTGLADLCDDRPFVYLRPSSLATWDVLNQGLQTGGPNRGDDATSGLTTRRSTLFEFASSLLRSVHGWRYVVLRLCAAVNPTFEVAPGGIGNFEESGVGAGGPITQE